MYSPSPSEEDQLYDSDSFESYKRKRRCLQKPNQKSHKLLSVGEIEIIAQKLRDGCPKDIGKKISILTSLIEPNNQCAIENFKSKIEECEYPTCYSILINKPKSRPVGHCCLVEVCVEKKCWTYYDSERDTSWEDFVRIALQHKIEYEGVMHVPRKCHQQKSSGVDCGYILLMILEERLLGHEPSSQYSRSQIDKKRAQYLDMIYADVGENEDSVEFVDFIDVN
ncbi:unnamed protein product [Dimorphilus gyrociliatus]|uniref:Uncharacterized protein n=1 Tax=Dimorphilus gyrociliatus TaxID=2664684 RepID=A0A7I8V9A1_9ANNE|nr:unnamed protein product [Dimorphilus gyrociliatus]